MNSAQDIIERVGRNIYLHQKHLVRIYEFSEEDLKYFPISYLEENVSPIQLQEIWEKLPKRYKSSPVLKLNLPCFKHFNGNTEGATQFDGPPPSVRSCPACQTNK